jgi:hypothetical protein
VVFSAVDYSDGGQGVVRAYRAPADASEPVVAGSRGLAAQVRGDYVFFIEERGPSFRLVRQRLGGGRSKTLYRSSRYPSCDQISGMQGNALGQAAVLLKCGRKSRVGLLRHGELTAATATTARSAGYLTLTTKLLWFASANSAGTYTQHANLLGTDGYRRVGKGAVSGECVADGRRFSWTRFHGDEATRMYAILRR